MESVCYILEEENAKRVAVFTGDTLFINEVGRPDLSVDPFLTPEVLAGHLYDSLKKLA